jgi:sulfite exporter TauE/SafE
VAYASLGLLFGVLGSGFFFAGFQQQLSILVGFFMILIAIIPENKIAHYNFSKPIYKLISTVKTQLGLQFKNKSYKSLFLIGLFNGYLPCGMVYVALFGAMAMNHVFLGSLYMILFGLGTIPLMAVVVNFFKSTSFTFYANFQKAIPVLMIFMGILFIVRGFGLNIPYFSPSTLNLHIQSKVNCH